MTGLLARRRGASLHARLDAIAEAVHLGEGRLPDDLLRDAQALIDKAGERLRLSSHTVAALAGATGSGKSSIFNALAGVDLAPVGVLRPTTGEASACIWGDEDAGDLLAWLGIGRRHRIEGAAGAPGASGDLDGLVLLDLPDHDSIVVDHRLEVDRLVERVDLLVWVLDPQKYADAAVHTRYLRPLAGHAGVITVVLNQVDRLDDAGVAACTAHLERLLAEDGLGRVSVLKTSAVTGQGLDALRGQLAERVARGQARAERIAADADGLLERLTVSLGDAAPAGLDRQRRDTLVHAMEAAAGVPIVADAVARSYRMRAIAATGWPVTRWVRRLRPDPLRRLGVGRELGRELGGELGRGAERRTSLPAPTPVQRSQLDTAVRRVADTATDGLPQRWADAGRRAARAHEDDLPDALDRAVATADLATRAPRWWSLLGVLQVVLVVAAIVGFGWLGVLAGFAYLRLPPPPTPEAWQLPVPTLLALGGVAFGLVVALLGRVLAAVGARRRRRRAAAAMREHIAGVAEELVLRPVEAELAAHRQLRATLEAVSPR